MADPTAPAADTDAEMPDVTAMPETADEVQDEDDGKRKSAAKRRKKMSQMPGMRLLQRRKRA